MYTHIHIHIYIYVYMYIERERNIRIQKWRHSPNGLDSVWDSATSQRPPPRLDKVGYSSRRGAVGGGCSGWGRYYIIN